MKDPNTIRDDTFREAINRELSVVKGQHTRTVNKLDDILRTMDALEESLKLDSREEEPVGFLRGLWIFLLTKIGVYNNDN